MEDETESPLRTGGRGRELAPGRAALRALDPVIGRLIDANPNLDPDAWRASLPVEGLFESMAAS